MLTVLFFTILCGALGIILFQCHALKALQKLQKEREEREEREEKQKRDQKEREEQQEREKKEREEQQEREEKEKQEEQARQERNKKKSTEALLARWKRESKKEKTMKDEGIYHLRSKKGRSTEDDKELAWYRAQIDQDHATAIMSM